MTTEARGSPDVEAAYGALQNGAMLSDRSDRVRMMFTGEKAAESLTGLVTNDVLALGAGSGQYAVALTAKGKLLADLRIFARDDGYLVDASPAAGQNWVTIVRKFVNPRLAKYRDVSGDTGDVGVVGSRALQLVRSCFPEADVSAELPLYSHVQLGGDAMIIRMPDCGVDGYDIIAPRDALAGLRSRLSGAGAVDEHPVALRIARIEAGRPEYGVDMDDSLLAQELDMERLEAISFNKGCYTGQETVARVHFRGHVNRMLRGLRCQDDLPPAGATLATADGKEVGVVKSGAVSPRLGAIALAIVRLEVEAGSRVVATWPGGRAEAKVQTLPFTAHE